MPQIETKHHNLEYRLFGEEEGNRAIMMFPSFGCHADFCFDEIILDLYSKGNNLYLFNHPAHGFSEGPLRIPEMQESIYEVAQDLKKRYNKLGGFGHSLGSYLLATSLDQKIVDVLVLVGMFVNFKSAKITKSIGSFFIKPDYNVAKFRMNIYDKASYLYIKGMELVICLIVLKKINVMFILVLLK